MAVTTEKKLSLLENKIKALKSTYSVYGGAMNLYLSVSPTYDSEGQIINAKIKFTPDYKPPGNLLISSIRCDLHNDNDLSSYAVPAVQDGSGSVIIQIPVAGDLFSVSLVSTSPGTFTRIS